MATNFGGMVTHLSGLQDIKSHDPLVMQSSIQNHVAN